MNTQTKTKTKTKPLVVRNYLSSAGQLNLTRLVDDAVEALDTIRHNGVGRQTRRSRGVIRKSFFAVMDRAGYSQRLAEECWRDQVLAIESLHVNANDDGEAYPSRVNNLTARVS